MKEMFHQWHHIMDNNQLDTELLAGYIDNLGKDIVQQMLDLYVQQSVIYLKDIEQAIIEQSQTLWQDYCHKMKGAAGSVGLISVHGKLVAIEKSTDSWERKQQIFEELTDKNNALINCFIKWLSEQK